MTLSKVDLKGLKKRYKRKTYNEKLDVIIENYKRCMWFSNELQSYWQITHGVNWLQYYIDCNVETINSFDSFDAGIAIRTNNVAVKVNDLVNRRYTVDNRNVILKQVYVECEMLMNKSTGMIK